MTIAFDQIPKDKPNNNNVEKGQYKAVVFKSEIRKGKESGNEYLNVSFKIDEGGFVNENYFKSDKPFLLYKLGRLLTACEINLEGEIDLNAIKKVIQGKKVLIDVDVNDRNYSAIDYSGNNEGLYPITETQEENLDPAITKAIESEDEDEDF